MSTFNVPAAVKKTAAQALALHKEHPLEGVGGIKIAETLTGGNPVEPATLARMRRFFAVNERHYLTEAALAHRPANSPLMRSWDLHGGQSGKTWCEAAYLEARNGGFVEDDPWVTLLRSTPDQVYEALGVGAWRWEYGMDPARAARFVESYHRATGTNLDLAKAFGSGRNAVSEAMIRRAQNENPFKVLARNLLRVEYQALAKQDMMEVKRSIGHPSLNWPGVIGTAVLAAREPKLTRLVMEGYPEPPMLGRDPLPVMVYSEPVADYVNYFHPKGAQFISNHPPGLLAEMAALVNAMHAGKPVDMGTALGTLSRAKAWTGSNRLAGNVGHILLEAARREDWPLFLDALPLDSPVRRPFELFLSARNG